MVLGNTGYHHLSLHTVTSLQKLSLSQQWFGVVGARASAWWLQLANRALVAGAGAGAALSSHWCHCPGEVPGSVLVVWWSVKSCF